jgi:hypothetical protein
MKTGYLRTRTFLTGVLSLTAGSVGCSDTDGDKGGPTGGFGGVPGSAGASVSGGTPATGGRPALGGTIGSGGSSTGGMALGTGGNVAVAGGGSSGTSTGGTSTGGTGKGNTAGSASGAGGSDKGGSGNGGAATGGAQAGGSGGGSGGQFTGTCTASKSAGKNASGTGPHDVVIETNPANGIKCGTIYRPKDLGGAEKYPIFVWGEGGCSQNGLSNQAAMGEIASWGYFVVADGTPGGTNACQGGQDGKALLDYITWAIAENDKPCSAYYQSLQTTKIAADGFSCGGLMAENVSGDPRFTAIGITSSGLMGGNASVYAKIHTPFKIMNGGPDDIAYENGLNDYEQISKGDTPIIYFSKTSAGHGGDLNQGRGDFNLVNLAWLNWQLKGDEGATGKGFLYGATCEFCTDSGWVYMSANIQ